MNEMDLIAQLRAVARHPGARGLADDAAVMPAPVGKDLVYTKDMIAEGVHYLPGDPPGDVAWKLLAVNLSDLAAKGARPAGVMLGYCLVAGTGDWDDAFVAGMARALDHFDVPLLGGDTIALPAGSPRVLSLTAIGAVAGGGAPDRRGARAGDDIWVSGTIGDAGAGLAILQRGGDEPRRLIKRYRLPMPRLKLGQMLAPHASAMTDVSDGLLIDAGRMATASGTGIRLSIDAVPISQDLAAYAGTTLDAVLAAATAGDDYELLAAIPSEKRTLVAELAERQSIPLTRIGTAGGDSGLSIDWRGARIDLPQHIGHLHG